MSSPYLSIKKIELKKQTAILTFDFDKSERAEAGSELKQIAILFGAYNALGRSIPLATYVRLKRDLVKLLDTLEGNLSPEDRKLKTEVHKFK